MKNKLLMILLLLFGQSLIAQTKDTIFIKKKLIDTANNIYSTIYIDSGLVEFNKNYTYLFFQFDTLEYKENFKGIKISKPVKISNLKIPKKWLRLHEYKNEFFTYIPCEPGENYSVLLTDTCLIGYGYENAIGSAYTRIVKNSSKEFIFSCKDYLAKNEDSITIKIVNDKKGIAVLSNYYKVDGKVKVSTSLLVDADKASRFRSIVHNCYNKENEFDGFVEPNYEKLLKGKK